MKRPLRVLLIGRRFWPHGSLDSAAFLYQLARALHRHGLHVEVIAPRYASSWPEEFAIREIPVHRPAAAPRSEWSMGRYVRHLTTWLRQHAQSSDVLLVDSIREEAVAAIDAARSVGCPTVVRCRGWGLHSDAVWWQTSRSARKCCSIGRTADAVIAPSAAAQRALLAAGFAASRIKRIDNGFPMGPPRSNASRMAARRALGAVNLDLVAEDDAPVLLCVSPMSHESGPQLLAKAAVPLIARYPNLRIWFVGDGSQRDWIYDHLRREGVRSSVAMPGSFCEFDDLFAAADLFVQADDQGLDSLLPSAVSAELPIISIDSEATRAVLGPAMGGERETISDLVGWIPGPTPKLLRSGIVSALDDLPARRKQASDLRRIVLRNRPESESVGAYVALMEQLVRDHPTSRSSSASIEAAS